jgi:hypothetical protein
MKAITLVIILLLSWTASSVQAFTTIDFNNRWAYGANIGWINWVGDTNNGAVISTNFCSGYIYAANVGWISLGNGAPANCAQYENDPADPASDFGVNNYNGSLYGYAYGANIGWVNFETNGLSMVDMNTGKLSGYVWSANCGWISLSNAMAFVQTDSISSGAPTLYISYSDSDNTVTLYWLACPSWVLEQNNNLTMPAGWSASSGVTSIGVTNYLTITPPTGNLFFRLINP